MSMALLCLNFTGFSQAIPVYNPATDSTNIAYKNRMNALFENVDLSLVPSGVLFDRGYAFISLEGFTGQLADSTVSGNGMSFGLAYASITSMTVDSTMTLPSPDNYSAVFDTVTPNSSVIPIIGLHQFYHRTDSLSLEDSLLMLVGDNFWDVPGRIRSPYIENELFMFASVTNSVNRASFSLNFASNQFYSNTGKSVQSLEIDLGNGQGFIEVNFDENIPIFASEVGRMIFKIKLTYTDSTVYYTRFDIIVTKSTAMLSTEAVPDIIYDITSIPADLSDPTTGRGGGSISVFLACGHERIEKPFIWAEAYNPAIGIIQADLNPEIILERIDHPFTKIDEVTLLGHLTHNGYDIIVLDYDIGTDYLPRTAEFIKEAIRWVNVQKASGSTRAKNVILGQSMGGVCTMQALREMENDYEDHECEKFIIFDSPIRGVNIPLSAQASLLDISTMVVNIPFDGEPEAPLFTFAPPIRDILNLYYAPATRTMMTQPCSTLYDFYDALEYDYHAYFDLLGYETEHLYEEHYNYLHGAMGGMPEDCEVIAIANGSEATTPEDGAHNFNAGDLVIGIGINNLGIGTIIAGLLPDLVESEYLSDAFKSPHIKSGINMLIWKVDRNNDIDLRLYAMENGTDFLYYTNKSVVSVLGVINITNHWRTARIDNGLEVDNAPGGFFGIENQGIFFPSSVEGFDLETAVNEFKMHTWCFTPTGSVLNFYDPLSEQDWRSNLYRSYDDQNYDISNNYTRGIDMYHANRFKVTFEADPVVDREYANTGHTWFTSDQSEFMLYFLVGKDELDGISELTSGTTFNYGKTTILPSTDFESDLPVKTGSILDHSLSINNTRLSVNANEGIGLTPSPYSPLAPGGTENGSHFVMLLGTVCESTPSVTLEITSNGVFDIGHYGTGRTGSVLVQSGHDLVVKAGGVVTVNPWSTLKLNGGGDIHIEDGGKLIIEDYGAFISEAGSTIHLYEGGEIELKGSSSIFDIGGDLYLHENAEFNPTHVGTNGGTVIWSSIEGGIIANTGSKIKLIGDGDDDPMLVIREHTKLIVPNTLDQFLLGSCQVLFRSTETYPLQIFSPFTSSNVHYNVQDNLELVAHHPCVASYNKSLITSSEFTDVCILIEEVFELDGYYAHLNNCNFDLTYNFDVNQFVQKGGNIIANNCMFNSFETQGMNLSNLTGYSVITNSDFTALTEESGIGIRCKSGSEILVKNCTFEDGIFGLHNSFGQASLKCNSFLNNMVGVGGSSFSRVEMSNTYNMGYNNFHQIGHASVYLDNANFLAIRGGYNKFYDDASALTQTIYGSIDVDIPSYLTLPGWTNKWNDGGTAPSSSEIDITDLDGDPVTYSLSNFVTANCGLYDPTKPPVVPIDNNVSTYMPRVLLTGESTTMRLDSAISLAHENTRYWDSGANNTLAIQYYKDILTYSYTWQSLADKRVQFHLKEAYNQMKNTIYYSFADSILLKSNNQSSFDSTVQKYVHVLNYLTSVDTFSVTEYRRRFSLELDKAHLFRMLGHTSTGLDILQNMNLCNLDSAEQSVLNHWMFVYEEQIAKNEIGLTAYGFDTTYTDTSGYLTPSPSQSTEFYFGSVINSISSINYRSCSNSLKPEDDLANNLQFLVYPNPSDGMVTLSYEIPSESAAELLIHGTNGQLIYSTPLIEGKNTKVIDLSTIESGLYIYTVIINGTIEYSGRIAIAH